MKIHKMISKVARMAVTNAEIRDAKEFTQKTQERLNQLIAENVNEVKALKTHTHGSVYPSIAIYETLQVYGLAKERAYWYVREYFQILSRTGSKFMYMVNWREFALLERKL